MTVQDVGLLPLLAGLCPMHAVLDAQGHLVQSGPTFAKLFGARPLRGVRFLDLIELRRPLQAADMAGLLACAGARLRLRLREPPPPDRAQGGALGHAGGRGGGQPVVRDFRGRGGARFWPDRC